jgi:transposase InsO family protein
MPWQEQSQMSLRHEFVTLASADGANIRALCRHFAISPTTGYKWLERYRTDGIDGLKDRSRRPHTSPNQTDPTIEAAVVALRDANPAWGARKLGTVLARQDSPEHPPPASPPSSPPSLPPAPPASSATALPRPLPSPSTITRILHRHDRIDPAESVTHTAWQRFEHAQSNDLWQMDFKGHVAMGACRCHPLAILDDHSRFLVGLFACANEQELTVKTHLTTLFRRYGLPRQLLTDNGAPWGVPQAPARLTTLGAWLVRLGIVPSHGRIRHPQTQGKVERFNRTFKAEVCQPHRFDDLLASQAGFDRWRETYNLVRPHEALALDVPASRYQPSPRPFPEELPPIEYGPDDIVRTVHGSGQVRYRNQDWYVGQALLRQPVALRATLQDGVLDVVYCHLTIRQIDLRQPALDALDAAEPSS